MIYRKNLYAWEQLVRVAAGALLACYALIAMPGSRLSYSLVASGALLAVTGFIGFCPMCAMVGRRLTAGPRTP